MILNRLGNKEAIADDIIKSFPDHTIYIEPFFGAGGLFFKKPKVKYNFLNDIDNDVYNLFREVVNHKDELAYWVDRTLITEAQFKAWTHGTREDTDLLNAVRFLVISNYALYGKGTSIRIGAVNPKPLILQNIDATYNILKDCYFVNADFEDFFRKLDYKSNLDKCFCYADPPYLRTVNNYKNGFTEADSVRLFNCLQGLGIKWAMSEFNDPFILAQAEQRGLHINIIGERANLMNTRTEILITNYIVPQLKLFQ